MTSADANHSIGVRLVRAQATADTGMAARLTRALARQQLLDEPAPTVGRYEIRRKLGGGGMGAVFEAWDPRLARAVAIKVLHAEASVSVVDLEHEARLLARLSDPSVVTVYDVGVEDGQVYLCMALIEGGDAAAWLSSRGGAGWAQIVGWFADAARGLYAAHKADVVHCDFKLENLLIGSDGRARVTDFGLARVRRATLDATPGEPGPAAGEVPGSDEPVEQTWSSLAGTPGYIAPEVREGKLPTPLSDQWALFVALGRALSHARTPPPPELVAMIERGTATEPGLRYPNLGLVEDQLRAVLGDQPARGRGTAGSRPQALSRLVEIATLSRSRAEFRRDALEWVDRHVGFDTALFGDPAGQGADAPTILNFDPAFVAQFAAHPERYGPTLAKIVMAAATRSAPLRDIDVYGATERGKIPFYTELIGRKGSKVMSIGALALGGSLRGTLQISRAARGTVFREPELELLREALPILTLGEGVHPGELIVPAGVAGGEREPTPRAEPKLTKREREILDYVALGLSNAEIALACGTSINTVRGQVSSLLRKLGAATRTELVAVAVREGVLRQA